MRSRKHRPTKGMTGGYKRRPAPVDNHVMDTKADLEKDKEINGRLCDLEIVLDPKIDWFRNVLAAPKYMVPEAGDNREALIVAHKILKNRSEFCRVCALPIRWKTDLVTEERAAVSKLLAKESDSFKSIAEKTDPGNIDNPDAAAGRLLGQLVKSWRRGEYCECGKQANYHPAAV